MFLDPAVAKLLDTVLTGFIPTSMHVIGTILIFVGMAVNFRKGREGELSVKGNAISEI